MKYAVAFSVCGVLLGALSLWTGGATVVLLWPAADLLVLAVVYGARRPRLLGKRPDGRLSPLIVVPMLPYFALTWLSWHLWRLLSPKDPGNEVAAGLWVGRRPLPGELPEGCALVVDLTAELVSHPSIRSRGEAGYLCVPTLDARAPAAVDLERAVDRILRSPGPVWIHCAAGHGRSAAVAAAALIARGDARDVGEAEASMRRARPGIGLHGDQRRAVQRFASQQKPTP